MVSDKNIVIWFMLEVHKALRPEWLEHIFSVHKNFHKLYILLCELCEETERQTKNIYPFSNKNILDESMFILCELCG